MQDLTQAYLACKDVLADPKELVLPFKGLLQTWPGVSEAICEMVSHMISTMFWRLLHQRQSVIHS